MIAWFKSKLKTPDYQKYVKHVVPPANDLNMLDRKKVKEEMPVKQEAYRGGDRRKREKDSVGYKGKKYEKDRNKGSVHRKRPKDSDEENRGFAKPKKTWDTENWEADNIDENRDWGNWGAKGKVSQGKNKGKFL